MSKVENGNMVSVHYRGSLTDGTEFDNSYDRGEALTFQVGAGQMITGFDAAVVGMEVGEVKEVTLASSEAYGPHNPEAVRTVSKEVFPDDFDFAVGTTVHGTNREGSPVMGTILNEEKENVILDFNHPMAGHELNFKIELVDINDQTD